MWAPMTRETSSESPGSTHQSSCQRPPYPRVRGCAPRRNRLGRHLGGALRQRGLGRRLGGALHLRHLGWRLCAARVSVPPPGAAPSVGVAPRRHRLGRCLRGTMRRRCSFCVVACGFAWFGRPAVVIGGGRFSGAPRSFCGPRTVALRGCAARRPGGCSAVRARSRSCGRAGPAHARALQAGVAGRAIWAGASPSLWRRGACIFLSGSMCMSLGPCRP
jgi:hypothetical protein